MCKRESEEKHLNQELAALLLERDQEHAVVALKRLWLARWKALRWCQRKALDTLNEQSDEVLDRAGASRIQPSSGIESRSAPRGSVAARTAARPGSLHVASRTGGGWFRSENVACTCW